MAGSRGLTPVAQRQPSADRIKYNCAQRVLLTMTTAIKYSRRPSACIPSPPPAGDTKKAIGPINSTAGDTKKAVPKKVSHVHSAHIGSVTL